MPTKIELIVDDLADNAAFDTQLPDLLEKARALPGAADGKVTGLFTDIEQG